MTETATRTDLVLVNYDHGTHDTRRESGAYFAVQGGYAPDWFTLVVPESDPRHAGMWAFDGGAVAGELAGVPESGGPFYGWRVPAHTITLVESPTTPDLSDASVRRSLPVKEAYPIGSVWNHFTYGETPCTVMGYSETPEHIMVSESGHEAKSWPRGALDAYGTFVSLTSEDAPEQPEDAPESFTREQLEEAVRQAKAAVVSEKSREFDAWKVEATETAHRYADNNSLCSEFDRCMEEIGLTPRDSYLESEYDVTVTYRVSVTAQDHDSAVEQAKHMFTESEIRNYGDWEAEQD